MTLQDHEHEVRHQARLLQVALGHVSSAVAPLGLDETYHKGIDMTVGLGPLATDGARTYYRQTVGGVSTRELAALRPRLYTEPLDFALSVVKIRDESLRP